MLGHGFGFPGFILLAMFLKFVVIAALVVFIGKRFRRAGGCRNNTLTILDTKFAAGEITEEEYLKRKAVLTQ